MTGREEKLYTWIKFEFKPNKERSNIHGELQLPLKERKLLAIQHLIVSQKREYPDLYKQNHSCNLEISHH